MSKPLFAECMDCGERWKIGTLPIPASNFAGICLGVVCPCCKVDYSRISLCQTSGPDAVTEPRKGEHHAR